MNDWMNFFKVKFMFDNSIVMAIVAINMTVIGLTSLADKKNVIGIDYGDFLMKHFKLFGVKVYHWLIGFALINVISLFTIFIENQGFRIINFICLTCSLMFAIYYFFGFILVENIRVVKEVYIRELLGLYCDSDDKNHHESDMLVKMNSGTRTTRKMSTDIIHYFSHYNAKTQKDFIQAFGPESCIYSQSKKVLNARKKYFNIEPFKYRISQNDESIKEISFEFFQMFRMVDQQEKWALEILEILDGDPKVYKGYDKYRLYNFARLTAQINTFGVCENLYKYKFLFYYRSYWYKAVDQREKYQNQFSENDIKHFKQVEKYTLKCLFEYICKALNKANNEEFIMMVHEILEEILLKNLYRGYLSVDELIVGICETAYIKRNKILQDIIEQILTEYSMKRSEEGRQKVKLIKECLEKMSSSQQNNKSKQINIFSHMEEFRTS